MVVGHVQHCCATSHNCAFHVLFRCVFVISSNFSLLFLLFCFQDYTYAYVVAVDYATSFNVTIKRLETLMADSQFNTLLRGLKKDLDLATLAVMPVQRVPRFKLLLEEAIRNTPDTHPGEFKYVL